MNSELKELRNEVVRKTRERNAELLKDHLAPMLKSLEEGKKWDRPLVICPIHFITKEKDNKVLLGFRNSSQIVPSGWSLGKSTYVYMENWRELYIGDLTKEEMGLLNEAIEIWYGSKPIWIAGDPDEIDHGRRIEFVESAIWSNGKEVK